MSERNPASPEDNDPNLSRRAVRKVRRELRKEAADRKGLLLLAGGSAVAGAVTGLGLLFIVAFALFVAFVVLTLIPIVQGVGELFVPSDSTGTHIGMGAEIDPGARLEEGARVDMGAHVKSGAVVKRGAVVGMGATVESDAVIEEDAVVGWGVTVRKGAVVKRGAKLGAGCTVERNAVVAEGMQVGAGSVVAARFERTGATEPAIPATPADSRDGRIDELCDRIEAELKRVSPNVNEFLSSSKETVASVRRTCHDLLKRERELRREANPADQERLNREAAALEGRIAAEPDEVIRQRLQGAVDAIAEQRRQRELLLRDANRLEAEQTRLVWTMEGLLAHVIRLRTTEAGSTHAATAELDQALSQLREEVSSVSNAMEHVHALEIAGGPADSAGVEENRRIRTPTRS